MAESSSETPMMKQFKELKEQYSDCILLFRAGDFYETFYQDAKDCAELLGITLTKRGDVPMAGVPFHSITPYIRKLLHANKKVALCEQLEDPKKAKGLVKRGVTRVITPGTILEDEYLSSSQNNYIMCIYAPKSISEKFGVSIVDITTGEFLTTQVQKLDDVKTLIKSYLPNEVIVNESGFTKGLKQFVLQSQIYYNLLSDMRFHKQYAEQLLKKQFSKSSLELGLVSYEYASISSGALLFYIYKLQKLSLDHINKISYLNLSDSMIIDSITIRNLEIVESLFSKDTSKTLYGILNKTKTPLGARLLKKQLVSPLLDQKTIEKRLDAVEEAKELVLERNELRELLSSVGDIERITSRITSRLVSPRDIVALKISLEQLPTIKQHCMLFSSEFFQEIKKLESFDTLVDTLKRAFRDDAPAHTRDMGFLKTSYTPRLEELSKLAFDSKMYLKEFEESQRLSTGIATLKVRYNRVFGYYIEVPNAQVSKIPQNYISKQTLTNAQRYTTDDLIQLERDIIGAEEKSKQLELELYEEIVDMLQEYVTSFQSVSYKLALLDVFTTHALNAQLYHYIRPQFSQSMHVEEGRNAIVEQFVSNYVSNSVDFTSQETCKIITGPNMAGKSTYLRQVALISIMAQIGSFIPAQKAVLPIYDRVFTRIGAHDELAEGQSTFMVEMSETAVIMEYATEQSLVLLDEIGRGTSTYDGLAIAWAVTEELATRKTHTVFATHYHQLNMLSSYLPSVENYHVVVKEEGNTVEFIRKIEKGGTDKSYGIYVAKLAGIPQKVISRAEEIQKNIEDKEDISVSKNSQSSKKVSTDKKDLNEFL